MAAVGIVYIKELFPTTIPESDLAAKMRLELMAEIVEEVGPDAFLRAVRKAISLSRSRYDCTIMKIRECAGLKATPEPSPAAQAWEFVTEVLLRHVRMDANGNYRLEPHVVMADGKAVVTDPPEIPEPILRAVRGLGGWGALAAAYPEHWGYKMKDFRDLYHEDPRVPIQARCGEMAKPSKKSLP